MAKKNTQPKDNNIEKGEPFLMRPKLEQNPQESDTNLTVLNSTLYQPGHKGSLSKRYTDPIKLVQAIEAYFANQDDKGKPYTISGLALALGFNSRQSLLNYQTEAGYEPFHEIMEKTRLKIESQLEEHLLTKQNIVGAIFIMKNSHGYKDSTEVDLKSKNEFITQLIPKAAGHES